MYNYFFHTKINYISFLLLLQFLLNPISYLHGEGPNSSIVNYGKWEFVISNSGLADIYFDGEELLKQSRISFKVNDNTYFFEDLTDHVVTESFFEDQVGSGRKIEISANLLDGNIIARQYYYLYTSQNYFITEFTLESEDELTSNYMAPILADVDVTLFMPTENNHSLWVPYDNDKWVRYHLYDFGSEHISYEVGALFNSETRNGLVTGSVEHSTWKTGVKITTTTPNILNRLEVFGGVTSYQTRDVLPHGAVKGKIIRSPKIMMGWFEDWRKGMETFAKVNEMIAPRLEWNQGNPFIWNSWGAIQTNLSFTNAIENSEYFANTLKPAGFQNDNTVYIGLDSYWDNITFSNILSFVRKTNNLGMDAGIYWTPFVDWGRNPDRPVEGSTNVFYRDIYLYANGQPQEIATAYAIDPTHPATKRRIDLFLNRFIIQGFTFIKLDFLTHGSLESDSFYNPNVTTGKQAYNYGLKYINDLLDGRMFINFAISPLFPGGQYAHSRRIACDAYASIADTEYTLNSLTYGWWLDHVYSFNDADNIVLSGASLGENRARVTSSVITGIVSAGDDFSSTGPSAAKVRAEAFLTNHDVNNVARNTKAFYPVEAATGGAAADMFMQFNGDTLYLAVFNYTLISVSRDINFERIGLEKGKSYRVHELWSKDKSYHSNSFSVTVPRRDVKLFKIYESVPTGIIEPFESNVKIFPNPFSEYIYLDGKDMYFQRMIIYNVKGQIVRTIYKPEKIIYLGDIKNGLYFISLVSDENKVIRFSVVKM